MSSLHPHLYPSQEQLKHDLPLFSAQLLAWVAAEVHRVNNGFVQFHYSQWLGLARIPANPELRESGLGEIYLQTERAKRVKIRDHRHFSEIDERRDPFELPKLSLIGNPDEDAHPQRITIAHSVEDRTVTPLLIGNAAVREMILRNGTPKMTLFRKMMNGL